ncbi:GAF domain-containing protein [Nonlabens tegetincola]|uniref:GAF domain-containing protein n=1 Tax=Nonlabens tegetincola TaxID=323273 RepID=UPI000A2078A0|nr:GAF domain-containing protein [Nonlabens tegetincola]ARN70966.1 GAF domain-containing protein [Nonlabens tegetincola]
MKEEKEFFQIKLNFKSLLDTYVEKLELETSNFKRLYLSSLIQFVEKNEALYTEVPIDKIAHYESDIDTVLTDLFPTALTLNEIKAATVPFSDQIFNLTTRFKNIISEAGDDFKFDVMESFSQDKYRMACGAILKIFYGRFVNFSKPLQVSIKNASGALRTYRITYNADFVRISLNDEKYRLSETQIAQLLREHDNMELWKEYFPPQAYSFEGFGIISLTDVTIDNAISELKTIFLNGKSMGDTQNDKVESIFRTMFGIEDLRAGFTSFNHYDKSFETLMYGDVVSYLLGQSHEKNCENALCRGAYKNLINDFTPLVISDVEEYLNTVQNTFLAENLMNNGIKSATFYPVHENDRLLGILELVSGKEYELNNFNVSLLDAVAPYLKAVLLNSEREYENSINAIIQTECTSIHDSVKWKFENEARRILKSRSDGGSAQFEDLKFEDVYPLYGQIDIVGSSDTRNKMIKDDLLSQLEEVEDIFAFAKAQQPLPLYAQLEYRVHKYVKELRKKELDANTERKIIKFLAEEIHPVFNHFKQINQEIKQQIETYESFLDPNENVKHSRRIDYDKSVQIMNDAVAGVLDKRQVEAQRIYPHFFERFKTDGVEHNIYVGNSITTANDFNPVYLYNLRLWQLQVLVELENKFYELQKELPVKIEAASMILAFENTLTIRYRIDEKRFDVDGSYNARYEVVKKRIDKALIKGTNERITQRGKIAIVYASKDMEREYLRYIDFLKHNNLIEDKVEKLELEDVQGVAGLKALRVSVLYNFSDSQTTLTYNDLIKELQF